MRTLANRKKGKQTIYKTLHKKLNTEQHEHNKTKLMKTTTTTTKTKNKKQIKRRMG